MKIVTTKMMTKVMDVLIANINVHNIVMSVKRENVNNVNKDMNCIKLKINVWHFVEMD